MNPSVDLISENTENKPIVYVLDDEREVGVLICRMVHSLNLVALAFDDVNECLSALEKAKPYAKPATIILDLALGKTDAIEVLDKLKALKYTGNILLISGSDDVTLFEIQKIGTLRGLTMLPFLKKPFRLNNLKERINFRPEPKKATSQNDNKELSNNYISRALVNGQLEIWYDSKLDIKSGIICGAEAVLCTQHPSFGYISAVDHLPQHDSPLNHPLSRFIVRKIMADWKLHFAEFKKPMTLSTIVPLSVIASKGFIDVIRESLPNDSRFPGLILDITDWKLFNNDDAIRAISAQLNLYHVNLAVDDIGAIYSSIFSKNNFPFKELKLDRNIISGIMTDETNKNLCRDFIDLAHRVNASVCAKGISNNNELQALTEMGCDTMQMGKPEPIERFKTKASGPIVLGTEKASSTIIDDPYAWPIRVAT